MTHFSCVYHESQRTLRPACRDLNMPLLLQLSPVSIECLPQESSHWAIHLSAPLAESVVAPGTMNLLANYANS